MDPWTKVAPLLAGAVLVGTAAGSQAQQPTVISEIDQRLEQVRGELIAFRRDLHRHPELSGQEERTAHMVAERLRALGLEVRTGVGGHGVVGVLRGGRPGGVVAYRADMDAVASGAPDPVSFASETPGVRHICGHDIHTTVGIAIAEGLSAVRTRIPGTVVFLFQPSEENLQGAAAMLEAGVLDDPAPQAIFAVHSAPLEVGQIGSVEGLALPGLDQFSVTLRGDGDREAAAADYRRAISQANTSRDVAPETYVGILIQGLGPEAEDGSRTLYGLIRAGSSTARQEARQRIAAAVAETRYDGVAAEFTLHGMLLPDMVNDTAMVRGSLPAIRLAIGDHGLFEVNQVTPAFSEDFARYQQHIPGAMYWLGVSNSERGWVGMPHSPDFVADEEAIVVGAKAMSAVLLWFLGTTS